MGILPAYHVIADRGYAKGRPAAHLRPGKRSVILTQPSDWFGAFGTSDSEKKTETTSLSIPYPVESGQQYRPVASFSYPWKAITKPPKLLTEINRRIHAEWAPKCYRGGL